MTSEIKLDAPIENLLLDIGQKLDKERRRQKIKMSELSKRSGVSETTLSKLWKGSPVKTSTLLRILRALDRIEWISELIFETPPTPMERAQGKVLPVAQRVRQSHVISAPIGRSKRPGKINIQLAVAKSKSHD